MAMLFILIIAIVTTTITALSPEGDTVALHSPPFPGKEGKVATGDSKARTFCSYGGYKATGVQRGMITGVQDYKSQGLQGYKATGLQPGMCSGVQDYKSQGLQGYKATGVQGYKATGVQTCKIAQIQADSAVRSSPERTSLQLLFKKTALTAETMAAHALSLDFLAGFDASVDGWHIWSADTAIHGPIVSVHVVIKSDERSFQFSSERDSIIKDAARHFGTPRRDVTVKHAEFLEVNLGPTMGSVPAEEVVRDLSEYLELCWDTAQLED